MEEASSPLGGAFPNPNCVLHDSEEFHAGARLRFQAIKAPIMQTTPQASADANHVIFRRLVRRFVLSLPVVVDGCPCKEHRLKGSKFGEDSKHSHAGGEPGEGQAVGARRCARAAVGGGVGHSKGVQREWLGHLQNRELAIGVAAVQAAADRGRVPFIHRGRGRGI